MSDEDRLRERFRDEVAEVAVVANLDDVAARIGRHGHGRERPLVAAAVLALVLGTVSGFAVGRIGRGTAPSLTVAGDANPGAQDNTTPTGETSSTGVGRHAVVGTNVGGQAIGMSWQPLFVRTTSDGVTIRVYLNNTGVLQTQPTGVGSCPANGGCTLTRVIAELSTDAAVTEAVSSYSASPKNPIGRVVNSEFGLAEQAPAQSVIVQVRSDVARVRVRFGASGSDEMQPQQGIAVLARVGSSANATLDTLDSQGHVLQTQPLLPAMCAPNSGACTAPALGTSPPVAPTRTLPAPGPNQPSDATAARQAVSKAFAYAFGGGASDQAKANAIEGGTGLVSVFDQLRHGPVAKQVAEAKTVIDGIVFLTSTTATVEFHSDLGADGTSGPYFGDATLAPTGWQISHASYCQIIIPAGAQCP